MVDKVGRLLTRTIKLSRIFKARHWEFSKLSIKQQRRQTMEVVLKYVIKWHDNDLQSSRMQKSLIKTTPPLV